MSKKSKSISGLRGIFEKLRRSNSGNLEDFSFDGSDFKRGGVRATAGPRLGWSNSQQQQQQQTLYNANLLQQQRQQQRFEEWNIDAICEWFDELGLGFYQDDLRKWLKNGGIDLINATPAEISKEINLKSPLHLKKIYLSIKCFAGKETDEMTLNASNLDVAWVRR